jgi:hypothetical protein
MLAYDRKIVGPYFCHFVIMALSFNPIPQIRVIDFIFSDQERDFSVMNGRPKICQRGSNKRLRPILIELSRADYPNVESGVLPREGWRKVAKVPDSSE